MHLNNVPASPHFGKCAYGTSAVSVQGATPALLVGQVGGGLFGPNWLAADGSTILYQSGGTGSGPWILQSYNVTTPALVTVDSNGQNFLAAGGGVWAAYLAGSGVRSNVAIASPTAPLAGAYVGDVSVAGRIVLIDYQATGVGLTVYSNAGAAIYSLPTVQLTNGIVRLVGNILSYRDTTGWHLRDITTGEPPNWAPPLDAVNWIIPVTMADGSLWVVERTEVLRVREAFRNVAYVIEALPIGFNPDAIAYAAGVLRTGYCTDLGESVTSAKIVDLTLASGATSVGVVSGGTIVFSAGATITPTAVSVGPPEGGGNAGLGPPFQAPIAERGNLTVTTQWRPWFQKVNGDLTDLIAQVENLPVPPSAASSFGVVTVDTTSQPAIAATQPNDTANLTSDDGSIDFTTNPATKTIDLSVNPLAPTLIAGARGIPGLDGNDGWMGPPGPPGVSGSGSGVCYVPASTGAEPLVIVSNGAGSVALVPYTP